MTAIFEAALQFLPLLLLVSIRVGVVLAGLPAPFGSVAPVRIRAALGLLIAFALTAPYTEQLQAISLDPVSLARAGLGEILIGGVMALTVRVTFAVAEIAGSFAGLSMGIGFAGSIDPLVGEQALPTSRLLGLLAMMIFLILQGHHVLLMAIGASLELAPPGNAFGALMQEGVLRIGRSMLAHGLRIASPVVATMFIVQLGTGLVSRAAPRVQIFAMSFAIAASVGMLTLFLAAPTTATAIAVEVGRLQSDLVDALGGR